MNGWVDGVPVVLCPVVYIYIIHTTVTHADDTRWR
jgi:hypothetical protein